MIQFNLLPDVKLEYLKARRTRRLVVMTAVISAGTVVFVTALLFTAVNVLQKRHLSHLTEDINRYSKDLEEIPDLSKILTVQNQLSSLPGLHDEKVVAERLFGYVSQVTPAQATISDLKIDFVNNTIIIKGGAESLGTVNKFADTLKFTKYESEDKAVQGNAFTSVVLSSFGRDAAAASYEISFSFDPNIFSSNYKVALSVPSIISTRSATQKPSALFQESETNNSETE